MLQINEERTKRLQLRLPRNELVAIEEFRFRARMPNQCGSGTDTARDECGETSDVDLDEPTHPMIRTPCRAPLSNLQLEIDGLASATYSKPSPA
jgi:hypothetical protein